MSFPKYPNYKPSGVEWLGDVPDHWELAKIKHIARIAGGGTPSRERPEFWNGDIPWVSPKDMKTERIVESEECITQLGLDNSTTILVPAGRLLMVIRSGILQHSLPVAINDRAVALNQDLKAFEFRKKQCLTEFFFRWVQGLNDQLLMAWANEGATVESLNQSLLRDSILGLPPFAEQTVITRFLDRETSKIDSLVAEQRRLIELLKEKRRAVISHAVTKGLNPHAPMKPSGIEWLGDVPEHWEVKTVRHACQIDNTLRFPIDKQTRSDLEGEYPYYGPTGVLSWINEYRVDGEYFLLGEDGDHFLKFETQPMTILVNGKFNVNNHAHLVRGSGKCSTAWACRYFEHKDLLPWLIKQGVGRYKLRKETLQTIPIVVPPRNEQENILSRLDDVSATTVALTAEAERGIELLQERRTALISAAVTGKIDVREFANMEAA